MKVGMISDTHGDAAAWRRAMETLASCDLILHAGDHLYNGAFNPVLASYDPKELARLMNECPVPILHARGNCDSEVDQLALRDPIMSPYLYSCLEGLNVMVTHGHTMETAQLVELAQGYRTHLLVRGHTHIHGIWEHGKMLVCNPGSPSLPKGDGVPSLAVLEAGKVTIYDLDGAALAARGLPQR